MLDPNKAVEQMQSEFSAGFQAGAASRDAYIEQLELALLQVRKAICGDIHNTDDLLDLIASRDAEIAELVAALETVIANAPEPYCAITRAVDAQCRAALAKTRKP